MNKMRNLKFCILFLAAAAAAFGLFSMTKPAPAKAAVASQGKIYLENIDVTGMTEDQIQAVIDRKMEKYKKDTIEIYVNGAPYVVTAEELGLFYANSDLAHTVASVGLNGNVLSRYRIDNYIRTNGAVFFSLDLKVTPDIVYNVVADKVTLYNKAPVNMKLGRNPDGSFFTIPKVDGYHVMVDETAEALFQYLCTSWHGGVGGINAYLETDEAVGAPTDDVSQITSILGTGSTEYETTGKFASRAANIANATEKINGSIVYPGEEFSAVRALLPFTEENGYSFADGYENGVIVDTIGGGVCQVSSTLYRAVLESELEVVERNQHSMIVGYVDPSMDATISENLDFRFINNTDAPIYIEGTAKDGIVSFSIYGHETRDPNRSIAFISEVSNFEASQIVFSLDPNMEYGEFDFEDSHDGLSARAYKVTYENGVETSLEQISSSHYTKLDGFCRVGIRNAPDGAISALNGAISRKNVGEIYILIGRDMNGTYAGTTYTLQEAIDIVNANNGVGTANSDQAKEVAAQLAAQQAVVEAQAAGLSEEEQHAAADAAAAAAIAQIEAQAAAEAAAKAEAEAQAAAQAAAEAQAAGLSEEEQAAAAQAAAEVQAAAEAQAAAEQAAETSAGEDYSDYTETPEDSMGENTEESGEAYTEEDNG